MAGYKRTNVHEQYLYDATGQRVKKWSKLGVDTEVTVYIDGLFEHRYNSDNESQNVIHIMDDVSRIARVRIGDQFTEDFTEAILYNLEDHLGSSTLTIADTKATLSCEEYSPFGESTFGSYAKKRYRFVGKEKDYSGLYYYGARYYLNWSCRFVSTDPLKEDYPYYTPYQYAGNKPINNIDLDGLEEAKPPLIGPPLKKETIGTTSYNDWVPKSGQTTVQKSPKPSPGDVGRSAGARIGLRASLFLGFLLSPFEAHAPTGDTRSSSSTNHSLLSPGTYTPETEYILEVAKSFEIQNTTLEQEWENMRKDVREFRINELLQQEGRGETLSPQDQRFLSWAMNRERRTQLRSNLGGTPGDGMEAHHIIPWALKTNKLVQLAVKAGFDINQAENGIMLPKPFHGNHPAYNDFVERQLDNTFKKLDKFGLSDNPSAAKRYIEDAILPELNAMVKEGLRLYKQGEVRTLNNHAKGK